MTFWGRGRLDPRRAIDLYLKAYRQLKAAETADFTVLLGLELRHYATVNDYLIYGVEEDWLRAQPSMLGWNEKTMSRRMHEAGYLVYQAHPFRPWIRRCDPALLDGIEVYNGHTSPEANRRALEWAKRCGLSMTSGSDTHTMEDRIRGGIETPERIRSNADLLRVLRAGNYRLLGDNDPA